MKSKRLSLLLLLVLSCCVQKTENKEGVSKELANQNYIRRKPYIFEKLNPEGTGYRHKKYLDNHWNIKDTTNLSLIVRNYRNIRQDFNSHLAINRAKVKSTYFVEDFDFINIKDRGKVLSNNNGDCFKISKSISGIPVTITKYMKESKVNFTFNFLYFNGYSICLIEIDNELVQGFIYQSLLTKRTYFISQKDEVMDHLDPAIILTNIMTLDKKLYPIEMLKFHNNKPIYKSTFTYERNTNNLVSETLGVNNGEKQLSVNNKTSINYTDNLFADPSWLYPVGDVFLAQVVELALPVWVEEGQHDYSFLSNYN